MCECDQDYYEHAQVPFTTLDGDSTTVDAGIFHIIEQLKEMGVRTQYSCEGGTFAAYVCADRKSFGPVIRAIRRQFDDEVYSPEATHFAFDLLHGKRDYHLHFGIGNGVSRSVVVSPGEPMITDFVLETSISNQFGVRTIVRWPREATADFYQLLRETHI